MASALVSSLVLKMGLERDTSSVVPTLWDGLPQAPDLTAPVCLVAGFRAVPSSLKQECYFEHFVRGLGV